MVPKLREMLEKAGTDCSGKWMGIDHVEKFSSLLITEIEHYIEESNGDVDYVQFLIDKNLK